VLEVEAAQRGQADQRAQVVEGRHLVFLLLWEGEIDIYIQGVYGWH
jgi:hypothetical protein